MSVFRKPGAAPSVPVTGAPQPGPGRSWSITTLIGGAVVVLAAIAVIFGWIVPAARVARQEDRIAEACRARVVRGLGSPAKAPTITWEWVDPVNAEAHGTVMGQAIRCTLRSDLVVVTRD